MSVMQSVDNDFMALNFERFSNSINSVVVDDKLLLSDTLEGTIDRDDPFLREVSSTVMPLRLAYMQLVLCVKGRMKVRVNMKEVVVTENCLFFTLPGFTGELLDISEDCSIAVLGLSFGTREFDLPGESKISILRFLMRKWMLRLDDDDSANIISLYKVIRHYAVRHMAGAKQWNLLNKLLEAMFTVISGLMEESLASSGIEQMGRQSQLFERFLSTVMHDYRTHRDVSYYADKLCVTQKYLSNVIHSFSGKRAAEWIRSFVIIDAKILLKSHKYTVQEVSEMLNFPNPSFFCVYFKRVVGCTPKVYAEG